jgi:hypothetical protein
MVDRDALYGQILARLGGELNPRIFEDAVCDLLRDTFPGLVPIRGGSDSGRDGAIADGEGEAFPLICTTGKDVLGNLTASLDSYLRHGGRRRKVVLATSQELSPQRRSNLEKRAVEHGFTLVQVIDQRGIADRLYRDSKWRQKLLELAGAPAALSVVPLSSRPYLDLSPVGRDEDLDWLRTTSGDRVLSGQPGSGKTFLLQHLIREGWPGLFLVSRDETEIANALREQAPGFVVIVDDAHADLDTLVRLQRLRRAGIGGEFAILATTWEGNLDSVVEKLGSQAAIRNLELLTRPEILEVYRQAGISEANTDRQLLRELVDQASNRPGLAATLAFLWLRGDWREVLSGKALSRHVRETFRTLVGPEAAPLLAAFALGGNRGMSLEAIGSFLGLNLAELWRKTAALAMGGALFAIEREVLAVRPHQLRSALIWAVFFPEHGVPPLPYRPLLDQAPSLGSAVAALIQARIDGVQVPDAELRELVSRADALDEWRQMTQDQPELGQFILHSDVYGAWQGLALSSEPNARWALDHYPGEVLHLASEALLSAPQAIIPLLLSRAPEFPTSFHSRADHPLQLLSRWIRTPLQAPEESLRRRRLLAHEIAEFLRRGGSTAVGLQAISLALSPKLEASSLDPGIGNVVTMTWGLLPEASLRDLGSVWAVVRGEISSLPPESWPSLATVLSQWIDPEHIAPGVPVSEETAQTLRELAASVIRDLAPLVRASPGLSADLRKLAGRLGLAVDLSVDPVFEELFPESDRDEIPELEPATLFTLVSTWSRESARTVAERLAHYEQEARQVDRYWPRYTPQVCREIAARIDVPAEWLDAFSEHGLPGDLAEPFFREILSRRPEGWETLLEKWLDTDAWGETVASLLAGVEDLPARLAERTLSALEAKPRLIQHLALRNEICLPLMRTLICSHQSDAALAAAIGAWSAHPRGELPPELRESWRQAILRTDSSTPAKFLESSLAQVLEKDPDLAFEWLRARIAASSIPRGLDDARSPLRRALATLDRSQREGLLANLVPIPDLRRMLLHLVGKDLDLYRQLLGRADLRDYHLVPLQGFPDPQWIPLALAAARAGWAEREIANAALRSPHAYSGVGLEYWTRWHRSFEALGADSHEEIRAIGKAGQELAEPMIKAASKEERRIARYGL